MPLSYPNDYVASPVILAAPRPALVARIAASAEVKSGAGVLYGADILSGAGSASNVVLRDTDANGDIIAVLGAVADAADHLSSPLPRRFATALYAVITGSPAHVVIHYE